MSPHIKFIGVIKFFNFIIIFNEDLDANFANQDGETLAFGDFFNFSFISLYINHFLLIHKLF